MHFQENNGSLQIFLEGRIDSTKAQSVEDEISKVVKKQWMISMC